MNDELPGAFPLIKTVPRLLLATLLVICCLNTPVSAEECIPLPKGAGENIELTKPYCVAAGEYNYGFINIHSGGKLIFANAKIDFWAKSILVENNGSLLVGTPAEPVGTGNFKNIVTFYLYGEDSGRGITCLLPNCGVPQKVWDEGGKARVKMLPPDGTPEYGKAEDYFYKYENLPTYPAGSDGFRDGDYYFGRKSLAVAYGGTVRMFGQKGATYGDVGKAAMLKKPVAKGAATLELDRFADWKPGEKILIFDMSNPAITSEVLTIKELQDDPTDRHALITIKGTGVKKSYEDVTKYRVMDMDPSGTSWARLQGNVEKDGDKLVLDRLVDWQEGDQIVLTATDYLPGHSELLSIKGIATDLEKKTTTITLKEKIAYPHNGTRYPVPKAEMPPDIKDKVADAVETRAAVALLSRNIRVVSGGDKFNDKLPDKSYFGGHTIVRQGVKQYQLQGVEFYQLGQGGRMAHSPVNFHMVRQAPRETFVADCSSWDSMTRWYEIRGAQGVMLNRNVGYKSIGHGYFLAEGTETLNLLQGNIGIYARPAVDYPDNPRKVPGVIAKTTDYANNDPRKNQYLAYGGDYIHPSVFFIMNGYNNFENNMAVGAGACGACYWIAPAVNSGLSRNQSWEGYAGIQRQTPGRAPMKSFHGNFCSTAQHSLITIDTTGVCKGVNTPDQPNDTQAFKAIPNPFAKYYDIQNQHDPTHELYPDIQSGATLQPVRCDVEKNPRCEDEAFLCTKGNTRDCAVSVIDSYTSSFHWAQQNYAAIWLRTNWFLFTDSALTDVLNGGLTMVSGGSWDQVMNQYWALTRNSIFVGHTQDNNFYATNAGPVTPHQDNKLRCKEGTPASYCRLQDTGKDNRDEGVVIPIDNFSVYQRLYNIYDGPVYQESNAFLHIKKAPIGGCDPNLDKHVVPGTCNNNQYLYWRAQGIPRAKEDPYKGRCILPNAAIGWKQPNGFYYPPAFHSRNLFFNDVDIRHFIIVPLFKAGTSEVDVAKVKAEYCTYPPGAPQELFADSFTDVDRQTELNDDDGSLSGLQGAQPRQIGTGADDAGGTIAINTDKYFDAPVQTLECLSEETCLQSPYDYMTAVIIPGCAQQSFGGCGDKWNSECENRNCYGVPIYRQYLNSGERAGEEQGIRMMGTGIAQRSILVANNGRYYIDMTVSADKQFKNIKTKEPAPFKNVFEKGRTYNFFLLYAKATSKVTFQLFIGKSLADADLKANVKMIRVGTKKEDGFVLRTTPLVTAPADAWPAQWGRKYDPASGILEVTIDLTDPGFKEQFDKGVKESCGPPSFCTWKENTGGKGGACVYAGDQTVIDYKGDDTVCQWSVKAMECPSGGCYGFQLALTADVADDDANHHRPAPTPFPKDWSSVAWKTADKATAGDSKQTEMSTGELVIESVKNDDRAGTVINLQAPGIDDPGKNPYTTVKRIDVSGQVTGWAWLKKGIALEKSALQLDRKVDWKPGEKIIISTPSTCVYPGGPDGKAPPTPAYIWDVANPK
ncbi:MAG: G8 domain-containing protein [Syntrophales bacterium]